MNPKTFFRLMLAVMILSSVASGLAAFFPGNISEDWRTVVEWNGNGGFYDVLGSSAMTDQIVPQIALIAFAVVLALFLLSVYIGLFLFWRFARTANLILTVLFLAIAPWSGLVIQLPLEAAFYDFTMICEGAVIALSYTSPIKDYFRPPAITAERS